MVAANWIAPFAPLRALPPIRDAVGSSMAVMLDRGIRRGTDVLKALALGAPAPAS